MRIAAKGMLEDGYKAHGRTWPRSRQIEIEVSREEYAAIARDPHIVSVVIPTAPAPVAATLPQTQGEAKDSNKRKGA